MQCKTFDTISWSFDFAKYIVARIRVYILKLFPDAFKDCKIKIFFIISDLQTYFHITWSSNAFSILISSRSSEKLKEGINDEKYRAFPV